MSIASSLPPNVTPRDIAKMMQLPGEIEVKDRSTWLNKYRACFVARDAVRWFVKRNIANSTEDAVGVGRRLLAEGLIYGVSHAHEDFDDNGHYFAFAQTLADASSSTGEKAAGPVAEVEGAEAEADGEEATDAGKAKKAPSKASGLPKLRGHLELWEDTAGLFSSGWKRRYFVMERKTKRLLYYPETMEQAIGAIEMPLIGMVGPTGEKWRFQIMVEQAIGSDLHDLSSADMIQDGKPLKRFVINARSKEEMNFWVDGLIRWIDYFRTQAKKREERQANKPKDEKTSLLSALEARAEARIAAASARRADEASQAKADLSKQLEVAHEQIAAAEKRIGELLTALNEARALAAAASPGARRRTRANATATADASESASESVESESAAAICMRPQCAAQRDELRKAQAALLGAEERAARAEADLERAAEAAALAAAADGPSRAELAARLEEQFGVLEAMQARVAAAEARTGELEAENEVLLEQLAELSLAAEAE